MAITATLQAGTHILPVTPQNTAMLHWASKDNSGHIIVKARSNTFTLTEPSFIEVTLWGTTAGNE